VKAIREDTLTIEKDRFLETVFGVICPPLRGWRY